MTRQILYVPPSLENASLCRMGKEWRRIWPPHSCQVEVSGGLSLSLRHRGSSFSIPHGVVMSPTNSLHFISDSSTVMKRHTFETRPSEDRLFSCRGPTIVFGSTFDGGSVMRPHMLRFTHNARASERTCSTLPLLLSQGQGYI